MRIVLDTNVLISALIKKGKPRNLFDQAIVGEIQLVLSEPILEEFIKVAKKKKFRPYFRNSEAVNFIALLERVSEFVQVRSKVDITRDKSDNMVLATALDGNAKYVVSGDEDLLAVREFKGIKVLTVDQMLKILRRKVK